MEVATGTRKIELTINEINYLALCGPAEMAAMGLCDTFEASNKHHLQALRRATTKYNDSMRRNNGGTGRASARVQL